MCHHVLNTGCCHVLLSTTGAQLFVRPLSGNDISLIPFAGLGSLSAAAEAALPFLLDKLAEVPGAVGDLVQTLGDGLMLRTGTPRAFDANALHTWAVNPAGALTLAGPSIVTTGLSTFATRLGDFIPDAITVSSTADSLRASIDPVLIPMPLRAPSRDSGAPSHLRWKRRDPLEGSAVAEVHRGGRCGGRAAASGKSGIPTASTLSTAPVCRAALFIRRCGGWRRQA